MPENLDDLSKRIRRQVESDIADILDKYKAAVDARVCSEIDAGACRTRRDYDHKEKMQTAEEEVRDHTVNELIRIITETVSHHKLGLF